MDKDKLVHDTMVQLKSLLKYDDCVDNVRRLHDDVFNYDVLFISEINKVVDSLKHQGFEPDYMKIIKNIHKRHRYKLDLYLQVFLLLMHGGAQLDLMDDNEAYMHLEE